MTKWELLPAETARFLWDEKLASMEDCSPFQSYQFGQYQQCLGWQPHHWIATDQNGATEAMCLGLLRRYPLGVGILWCPGGPVGNVQSWDEELRNTILRTSGLKRVYLRFRCDRERHTSDALFLNHRGWSRSITQMTSGFTMELDLGLSEDELLKRLHAGWRRNLRLAGQNDLKIELCSDPDPEELAHVFAEMEARKHLPQLFSSEKLNNLFKHAASNLIFYRCEDAAGNLICFRGILIAGSRACDYFAATTHKGRELRASYAVLWRMLLHCREIGISKYDLGGIDPWANPGVHKFKKNTGAREVELLGEWDWATSPALRFFGNWAIGKRQGARSARANATLQGSTATTSPLVLAGTPARQR